MDVTRLSVNTIRNMGTLCLEDDVLMLEKTHTLFDRSMAFLLDHVCVALVVRGSADFLIDNATYHVQANDMLVIIHQQEVRRLGMTHDFEARVVLMSRAYIDFLNLRNSYQMFLNLRREPLVHLKGEALSSLETCFNNISTTLRHHDNPYQKQSIYHLIKAYMYSFAYYLLPHNGNPRNRAEEVCGRFMALLENNYREHHTVGFYAERLHLTTRYMSGCIKTATGQRVIDVIAEKLMLQARKGLQNEEKTISQLSYELGFRDQSAFGKFFRIHEGIAPRKYRNNHLKKRQRKEKMENLTKLFEQSVKQCWNNPALTDYQIRTETYGELAQHIERLHLVWQAMGLQQGDKIAINARSTVHWSEVFWAAMVGEYVSVQLYNAFMPADVEKLVVHSDSKILYTEKRTFSQMQPGHMPNVVAIIDIDTLELLAATDEAREAYESAEQLFTAAHPEGYTADDVHYAVRDWDDVCAIMYTSGSTGNPKGVMLTIRNFSWNVEAFTHHLPYTAGDNYVSILPYAHIFGLTCDLVTPMCTGMHSIILGRIPIPTLVEEAMRAYSPKIFLAVPLVLAKFVEHVAGAEMNSDEGKEKLANYTQHPEYCAALRTKVMDALGGKLEVFATGGAAIPPAIEQLLAFQINMPFITGYGMSECAPLLSLGKVGKYKAKSCGETVESLTVRIASPDGVNIPGEFQVKGECVFAGYYKNPEATAEAFTEDGYFRTGDLGTLDSDSTLFLVGRCKNMLLSSNGQNIYPEEIEVLLNALPYVAESVVVQRDHLLHALIVPDMARMDNEQMDAEALHAIMEGNLRNLNTRLPQYASVATFELRFEPFAKTPKGSIRRFMYQ